MTGQATTTAPPGELYWRHSLPRRTDSKMLLLTAGEVAVIGQWQGEVGEHFLAWCPLPKKAKPLTHDIEAAVDAWLEMERKAAAWDALLIELQQTVEEGTPITPALFHVIKTAAGKVAAAHDFVHPAQSPSTC